MIDEREGRVMSSCMFEDSPMRQVCPDDNTKWSCGCNGDTESHLGTIGLKRDDVEIGQEQQRI